MTGQSYRTHPRGTHRAPEGDGRPERVDARRERPGRPLSGRDPLLLIAPACVWAVHFVFLYALISAACAPRALLTPEAVQLVGLVASAIAVVLALVPAAIPIPDTAMRRATIAVAGISAAAVAADASILLFFRTCGG